MKLLVPAVVLALGVLTPACAGAHEFWLAPSSYRAARGDTLRATAFVGTGFRGGLKPYAATRAVTWVARGSRLVDLKPESVNGDDVFGRWVPDDDGGVLFAYESNFVPIELPAEEFDAYLELEGLDGPRAERAKLGALAGDGRERYERCPKAWVAGRDPKRVTAAVGLSLELVPATDPSLPGPLKLRLLFRGEPLPGTRVRAWNHKLASGWSPVGGASRDSVGPVAHTRTDAHGVATLVLPGSGEWMLSAVHMEPSRDPRHADWESYWASLTFARAERKR